MCGPVCGLNAGSSENSTHKHQPPRPPPWMPTLGPCLCGRASGDSAAARPKLGNSSVGALVDGDRLEACIKGLHIGAYASRGRDDGGLLYRACGFWGIGLSAGSDHCGHVDNVVSAAGASARARPSVVNRTEAPCRSWAAGLHCRVDVGLAFLVVGQLFPQRGWSR